MKHSAFFKKPQIICLLLLIFLSSVNIFAQTEKENEDQTVESPFPEIENKLSNNDDEEICSIEGDKCWTRKELLEIVAGTKISGYSASFYIKAYFLLGDYNSVFSICNKLIEGRVIYGQCYLYRGFSYLKQGKYENAFKDFDCQKQGLRNSSLELYGCGEIYLHQRKYDEAFAAFDGALVTNSRFSKAYFGRGIIYLRRGEELRRSKNEFLAAAAFNNALSDFNSVIEIDLLRTPPETYQLRAKAYKALGYDAAAVADEMTFKELNEKK